MRRAVIVLIATAVVAVGLGTLLNASSSNKRGVTAAYGDGTTGTLVYQENFTNPASPIVNTVGSSPGNPQAANYGMAPTSFGGAGKWFGNWFPGPSPLGGVTNYADLNMNVPGRCPTPSGRCGFEAVDHGSPHYSTNQVGQTTYSSMAFFVPAGGLAIRNPSGTVEIQELHFENQLNGAAVRFGLYADHVTIMLDTGGCSRGKYCQYHSDADHYPSHPAGSILLPKLYAIAPGGIVAGKWNEVVVRIKWTTDTTGNIDSWYRTQGGTWLQGGQMTGIPTTQYAMGSQPHNTWNVGPEAYGSAMTTATEIYLAGFSEGTGFGAVAGTVP